jgi:hypothetical protein
MNSLVDTKLGITTVDVLICITDRKVDHDILEVSHLLTSPEDFVEGFRISCSVKFTGEVVLTPILDQLAVLSVVDEIQLIVVIDVVWIRCGRASEMSKPALVC